MGSSGIHVNPFQVKEIRSNACVGAESDIACAAMQRSEFHQAVTADQLQPNNRWRDTVIVPPYGFVRIWQRFAAAGKNGSVFVGKSVFHCHFLAHEDTGMIANMLLTNDTATVNSVLDRKGYMLPTPQSKATGKV